jgi:hypothetical protein
MKKEISFLFILLLISISLFGYLKMTGADVLSVNSGGASDISITPDIYTEGFFSNPAISSGGVTPSPPSPPSPPFPPVTPPSTSNISVSPSFFNLNMLINTNLNETVSVTNIGTSPITVSISQTNLTNLIIIENTTLSLAVGETKVLGLIFVAPNVAGVYNGKINIGSMVIPVSLTVLKQFILFDSNIIVLNKNYKVPQGNQLLTQVTMIPMGMGNNSIRLDVTLDYIIKNMNGSIYTTRSETVLVTSQKSLERTFQTGNLPIGNYTIGLELIYPYGVAPSSAYFRLIVNQTGFFSEIIYWLLVFIIIISDLILIVIIIRTIRRRQRVKVRYIKR